MNDWPKWYWSVPLVKLIFHRKYDEQLTAYARSLIELYQAQLPSTFTPRQKLTATQYFVDEWNRDAK